MAPTFYTYKLVMLVCAQEPFYNRDPERPGAHTPESNHSALNIFKCEEQRVEELLMGTHLECVMPAQQLSQFLSCNIFISGAPPQQDLHTVSEGRNRYLH